MVCSCTFDSFWTVFEAFPSFLEDQNDQRDNEIHA